MCILPAWTKEWVQTLVGVAIERIYFQGGSRIFELNGKPAPNTLWGVWAVKIKAGPRREPHKNDVYTGCVFIPRWRPVSAMGTPSKKSAKATQQSVRTCAATSTNEVHSKRALDLFSGTGSVSRELENQGFHVTSLDIDPRAHATHTCNILKWEYKSCTQREPLT